MSTAAQVLLAEGGYPLLGGTPVEDATVTVNGTNIPHFGNGMYVTTLTGISGGQSLSLSVSRGGDTITSTVAMPYTLTVTAPLTTVPAANPIDITWTISQQPQYYDIEIDDAYTVAPGFPYEGEEVAPATQHTIPGSTLQVGTVDVTIDAINTTMITGAGSGSAFGAVNEVEHTFTTN